MIGRCKECNRPLAVRVDGCASHAKTAKLWEGLRNAGRTAERKLDESGLTTREIIEEQGLNDRSPRRRRSRHDVGLGAHWWGDDE